MKKCRGPFGLLHFLKDFALFMQIMNNRFVTAKKYDNFMDEMLRKQGKFLNSANFDRGFAWVVPVEKPVESVNNFLNMCCMKGILRNNA